MSNEKSGNSSNSQKNSLALELSSVPKGFSPPLQISHSVVPKLHLSAAKLRLAESPMHSGGTQGILSMRTDHTKYTHERRWTKEGKLMMKNALHEYCPLCFTSICIFD